ncbi:GntR family transcriptional regulator [Leifsonia sp. LS-T14]|uniref:GntR family transcriptional regulator n=1 Tax=unclassified Leifsonia TaxID=2663824 RepID=UPI0035A7194D
MPIPSPEPQRARRQSLREVAIEKIKAAILDRTLKPGEELRDAELQEWLGMSRTPVREALIELSRLGLVEVQAQRFTRVADPDPATAIYDLQTLGALVGAITRVTLPTLTPEATEDLLAALTRVQDTLRERRPQDYLQRNYDLYLVLRDNCPNPVLVEATHELIEAKLFRISLTRINLRRDWDELQSIYDDVRSAVTAGDAVASELAIERIFQLDRPLPAAPRPGTTTKG